MKTSELRLGNFVKDRGGKIIRIDFIEHIQEGYQSKFGQLMFLEGTEVHPMTEYTDYALPIPLTPEILENNFGLKKIAGTINEYRIGNLVLNTCLYVSGYLINVYIGGEYLGYHSTVHSFQNLYFALSGEELTIKL